MNHKCSWKQNLCSSSEIASYVVGLSNYDVCREQIEEYFFNCHAKLVWISIRSLEISSPDHNLNDDVRQSVCDSLEISTMPPLLIENGKVIDGHHRLRTLLKQGALYHWAYDVEEIPEQNLKKTIDLKNKAHESLSIEP